MKDHEKPIPDRRPDPTHRPWAGVQPEPTGDTVPVLSCPGGAG